MRGALQIGALQELASEVSDQSTYRPGFQGGVYGYSIGASIAALIAFEFEIVRRWTSQLTTIWGNLQDALNPLRLQALLALIQ